MTPSTIGERRGLIILLALILITAIVTAVISSVTPSDEQPLPADVTDTVYTLSEKVPENSDSSDFSDSSDSSEKSPKKPPKKSAKKAGKKSPAYRSPLDEPVTP
ncbi:MAG: hypothetical protein K2L14_00460 [Duncaniella sp.]|nr:hypothetical protein [Duncaniella sp.]